MARYPQLNDPGIVPVVTKPRRFFYNDAMDRVIRAAYDKSIQENDRNALKHAADLLRIPRWRVGRRGIELGLSRVKEKPWSEDEIRILERFGHLHYDIIGRKLKAAGFSRTRTGIVLKRKRLRILQNLEGYSSRALAECFGIDSHGITRWIALGFLVATKRGTERQPQQGGDIYYIHQNDVKAFVFAHPEQVDLRKVDKFWFLDLVTDGKICG